MLKRNEGEGSENEKERKDNEKLKKGIVLHPLSFCANPNRSEDVVNEGHVIKNYTNVSGIL